MQWPMAKIKRFEAQVDIGRITSSYLDEPYVSLRVKVGRTKVIEVEMTAQAFALALLGVSEQPAAAELRDVYDQIEGVTPDWVARKTQSK